MNNLTHLEQSILAVIPHDEWISAADIGKALRGKDELYPYDRQLLNRLIEAGKVKVDKQPLHGFRLMTVYKQA